ncbi:hypothetical protein [Haloquadratum walsbyi]|jgi:hypothetical protein|uniref:Uncharacterized protein n=1 Tax=Haloquadratum walsbyi (strain DSM 16854 / JCM 12705 / C23) TaxID=768065 RepID=G0LJN4_HALWC|nr:hypothetical protein [Haloquadratum walsbyi]CCC40968.1 uncharacterized protein Hqrw_3185 [Haloquadratum walsbyi C23]
MSVNIETHWHPTTKLNAIGNELDFSRIDPLPSGVERDQIEEYCYTVEQLYGAYIETIRNKTILSQREAQTWVLRNLVHEGADRLTFDAVGLYIWAIGRETSGDPLSRTIIAEYHDHAVSKIDDATATMMHAGAPPYPDDVLDDPVALWVDATARRRIANRRLTDESYSDVLERLLDETAHTISLEELVKTYQNQFNSLATVAVQTVRPAWDREIPLSVHINSEDETSVDEPNDITTSQLIPEVVSTADMLSFSNQVLPFSVESRPATTGTDSMLVVYADGVHHESVSIADGIVRLTRAIDAADETLQTVSDRAQASGVCALGVRNEPVGNGVHLVLIAPSSLAVHPGDEPGGFIPPERLSVADRTLSVERVTNVTPTLYHEEYRPDTTLIWVANKTSMAESCVESHLDGPSSIPETNSAQRELFPTSVLQTG